ncbi:MAG: DUF3122 domain-containing protein, partial [Cyanobacteriota bacterium]|nr:DUF3122 domain-containing protein [Cyanobacteriota bacterium]
MKQLLALLATLLLLLAPVSVGLLPPAMAMIQSSPEETATGVVRSLESLRDLDYRSWQVVAYRQGPPGGPVTLRIVGYPGRVRLDHPTPLEVRGGRRQWLLDDITL